ncbi:DnaJ family molecular chaperone [Aerophototrophica crusticola]|uniref:DnaJ family molecular chaperone n=1 Tax=Aerophototrophica crusticola TaxID=1709002 RepID=A0A858R4G6_9PROT|nr:DnaJ family molecular chaperone [Rhodospirillaceae bacterium B3]
MSIWGKILGGAAGFAIGGPIGGLLGALAGHAVDELREMDTPQGMDAEGKPDQTKTIAFTVGVIVLGAKMAKADGVVHTLEVDAFKRVFHVPPDELKNVGRLFDLAKRDSAGYETYAKQLAGMFKDRKPVLEELLGGLFHIATADGVIHSGELSYLRCVADIFGFTPEEFEQTRRIHGGDRCGIADPLGDPYAVLGVAPTVGFDQVKTAYRTLVRENHPDRLIAQGLPQEFIDLAQEKMAAINAAYEKIEKAHRAAAGA